MHIIQVSVVFLIFFYGILYEVEGNINSKLVRSVKRRIRATCFCSESECCSKWGYCGKTDDYCGSGCQSGPCKYSPIIKPTEFDVTPEVFACVFPYIDSNILGRRLKGFNEAMEYMKWKPINSIEASIFLAHVAHETDGLKTLVEYCAKQGTCNNYQASWCSIQPHPNVKYYGRGWFQLSYPCNYYYAGKALGIDLLDQPDLVSETDSIAASTAIWYYKETGMDELAKRDKFGETIRKINEYECYGKGGYHMQAARLQTYQRVRKCFGLPRATVNVSC